MSRVLRGVAGEGAAIFTLGFLFALPHELYSDLCYQLVDGRAIWHGEFPRSVPLAIAAGPLVDHEWLFEAAAWPFWAHGVFPLFALLCAAAAAATPLLASEIARRCGATPWAANAVGYLTIAGTVTSYAVRPQTFAVLAFGSLLATLLGPLRRPWLVFVIVAGWANLHGSAPLALALVALVWCGRAIAGADAALFPRFALAFLAAALGTLATPLGTGLYAGATQYSTAVLQTADWRPLSLGYPVEFLAVVLYGYVLIAGGLAVSRTNAVAVGLLGAFALLWFEFVRFLPFFALAAVPALVLAIGPDGARLGRRLRARAKREAASGGRRVPSLLMAAPIAFVLAFVSLALAPLSTVPEPAAAASAALLRDGWFSGHAFVPFEAAAYLELEELPVRVLLDTHATPYAPDVWADYQTIDAARSGWPAAVARRGIAAAVAADDSALASALSLSPRWSRCRGRAGWSLFVLADAARTAGSRTVCAK